MDYEHRERTIAEVIDQLEFRFKYVKDSSPEETGSTLLGFIWSTDNANELIMRYSKLGEIEALVSDMDWQEDYQTDEAKQRLRVLIDQLKSQAASE